MIAFDKKFDYKYPDGLNLNPNSDLHKKLLKALVDRIKRGYATTQNSREMWRKLDHLQTAYVPTDNYTVLDLDRDPKAPLNVVIPVSRANLDTIVAYCAGVFFGDPTGMYPLTAHSSKEAMVRAAKMDRLLHMQSQWFRHKKNHYTSIRDTHLYGLSVKMPVWAKHKRRDSAMAEVTDVLYQMLKGKVKANIGDTIRYFDDIVYHEGSELRNIDVYSLILDPNATLNDYEKAEFLGYWRRDNAMNLLRDEADPENRIFNAKYVHELTKSKSGQSQTQWTKESGRFDRISHTEDQEVPGHPGQETTSEVDIAYLFWNLIPREWKLSEEARPQMWAFAVAGDEVIIQAYPLDYDHGKIPMVMDGPQTCGYELLPISSLSATYGLHQFIDWKVRMHYWNASRVNNSMFVIDGSAVNADDFKRGGPRQIIRLLRPLYGDADIKRFIQQLQVQDHTNDYPAHVQALMQFNDYCLGTHAITQGDMSSMPERPTQWGLQAAQQAALSRLTKDCQLITEQSYYTLVEILCHNNVQFLENEVIVQIIGSQYEDRLREEYGLPPGYNDLTVEPWDLDMGSFEIQTINRMQKETDLTVMNQMMERMLSIPEVAYEAFGGMDVQRFFLNYMRRLGFENVHEFRKAGGQLPPMQAQVMPDEQVMAMEQSGQMIPAVAMP